ncbi:MAG: GTP cyclohydrolase, FolE2/MptA family [Candidatus Peregrinibacteria bacterium]
MKNMPPDPLQHVPTDDELGRNFQQFLDIATNVPESSPSRGIGINEAGILNQEIYIHVRDIEGKNEYKPVLCKLQIASNLEGHRGVHMSRFEEALFAIAQDRHESIDEFTLALARAVRDGQGSTGSVIRVEGIYIHDHRTTKSQRISHDKLYLLGEAEINKDNEKVRTGIRAYNMNACPCTRAHTKYAAVPDLQQAGFNPDQIRAIIDIMLTGTHTQRGLVTVVIDKTAPAITSGSLFGVIDRSTHLVYELLKRPDEYELVSRTLRDSQYAEDVVRETAFNVYQTFAAVAPETTHVDVESLLHDSIHIHDVRSIISATIGDLAKDIRASGASVTT